MEEKPVLCIPCLPMLPSASTASPEPASSFSMFLMSPLGYADSSLETIGRLFQNVPAEWKGRKRIPVPEEWKMVRSVLTTPGGTQSMLTLTEQGLYFFLGRSDKPAALPFQKWLAGEVLPSIRKTGGYQAKTAQGFPDAAKSLFSFINGIR